LRFQRCNNEWRRGGLYKAKRYINQPKRRAPKTIKKKRERAYFIWLLLSDLLMRAKTMQTKAA
jgi:hypothetical protein